LGHPDAALARARAALNRAEAREHPHTKAYVSDYAAVLHALRGEAECVERHAERCLTLSQQPGFRQWLGPSVVVRDASTSMLDPALAPIEDVQRRLAEAHRRATTEAVI
jgi:hypothetical protein